MKSRHRWIAGAFGIGALSALACGSDSASPGDNAPDAGDDALVASDSLAGDDASDGASSDASDGGLTTPPFDWVGIIGTGQSLSVGVPGGVITTTEPFNNKKLVDNGPDPKFPLDGGGAMYAVGPLVAPMETPFSGDGQYPHNIVGETPNNGMADQITALWMARRGTDYVTLHSSVGWSGNILAHINKEGTGGVVGTAYPGSLQEARAFKALATAAGKTFGYSAIILTHGESDAANPDYGTGITTFINDYNTDLKAITGQTSDIVMLVSQQSTEGAGDADSSVQVWKAAIANPTRIVCTGPKYQFGYAGDNLHLPSPGYFALGEKYAEVYDAVVNLGTAWKPVQPNKATRAGKVITVELDVPNPPLVWSTALAPPHQTAHTAWASGKGFEVMSTGATPTELAIASVDITGPTTVTITLAADPGAAVELGYALTQDGTGTQGGLVTGKRGLLRDSDPLVGYDAESIAVTLTQASATVTATTAGAFAKRAVRDLVSVTGLPADAYIAAVTSTSAITLSTPWPNATTTTTIKVQHDLYNYAVHFALPVP